MATREQAGRDALYARERAVMARWDAGTSIEEIAADMGLRRKAVASIVSYLDVGSPTAERRAAATSSARLLAALQASGRQHDQVPT